MASLLWGVLFGSIGLGYFIYGKKKASYVLILSGIGLMIFPYFFSNTVVIVLIGLALVVVPHFL